jgi:hypothetical protein
MQTLLQDHLTQYWPIMAELSPALRRSLQHELAELLPAILILAVAFIFAWGAILLKIGTAAFFSVFLLSLAHLRLRNPRSDLGTANIEFGKLKVKWQGNLALGFLVVGLVLLILSVIGGLWVRL